MKAIFAYAFFIVNHIETEKRDHLYSRSHIGCYGQLMRMSCLSHNGCNILHGEIHKIVLCLKPLYSFLNQQYLKWNKRFSFLCIFYQIMNQSRRRGNLYKTNTGYMYLGAKSKRMGLIYVWRAGLTNEGLIIPLLRRQKVERKPRLNLYVFFSFSKAWAPISKSNKEGQYVKTLWFIL